MRRLIGVALAGLLATEVACAPKLAPAPEVGTPKYPEFTAPAVPAALADTPAAASEDRGWRFLQAGDLKNAEHEFAAALEATPGFFPASAGLGFVELARKDPKAAVPLFDQALAADKQYVPALVGRGQALAALERNDEALTAFEAAVAADPTLADVKRRIEVLKFRRLQEDLAAARKAAHDGRLDDAERAYRGAIDASPDSPFLYRELAGVERQKGEADAALDHFRKAAALDSTDAASLVSIGDLLAAGHDYQGAARAYTDAFALEPSPALEAKVHAARDQLEALGMPAEYRAIADAPQVTRADLAALIGVRLGALLASSPQRDAVLITDVRRHWAAAWIMAVARAGVMEPYANHAFQPETPVRRIDLAQVVNRLLERIVAAAPARAHPWLTARLSFPDLEPSHLAYPAASAAVAAGVLAANADHGFEPSRMVTGKEAVEAIGRLEALASPVPSGGRGGR